MVGTKLHMDTMALLQHGKKTMNMPVRLYLGKSTKKKLPLAILLITSRHARLHAVPLVQLRAEVIPRVRAAVHGEGGLRKVLVHFRDGLGHVDGRRTPLALHAPVQVRETRLHIPNQCPLARVQLVWNRRDPGFLERRQPRPVLVLKPIFHACFWLDAMLSPHRALLAIIHAALLRLGVHLDAVDDALHVGARGGLRGAPASTRASERASEEWSERGNRRVEYVGEKGEV